MSETLRIGRHVMFVECPKPNPTPEGLSLSGGILFEGGRGIRNAIARQHKLDLLTYRDNVVAVVSSEFPEIDGWYRLRSVDLRVDGPWKMFPFTFELEFVGTKDSTRWESRLIGATAENDFSIVTSEAIHAPPINHKGYEVRETTSVSRLVAYDDPIVVYRNLAPITSKLWSIDPNDFYRGAASVNRRDPLLPEYGPISGTVAHIEAVEDIEITNGIVRFWIDNQPIPVAHCEFWDGTAWRDYGLYFFADAGAVEDWNYVAIMKNNPEECILRYESGINGAESLTVSLRRGDLGISCVMTSDISTALGVYDVLTTNMTVTSNRSFYTAADSNGHKLGFVSLNTFSSTPADGFIYVPAGDWFDVFITNQLSGAATGNQAVALASQYAHAQAEEVRAVWR